MADDGADADGVVAPTGVDGRRAHVGAVDGEGVGAVAEQDGEVLEGCVDDAAEHGHPAEDRVVGHAEPGDPRAGQAADVGGRAVLVVDDEAVDLGGLDGIRRWTR